MSQVSTKPASGMRDFLPTEAARRARVFRLVEEVYESYGFEPLQTPAMERLTTLMGKYGDEGDQLLFKVMKRAQKFTRAVAKENPSETDVADHGLRYDLTVPLARVFAEYGNDLPRFFKRYQIAPVWRADRPQHGRFREFIQCDVDVVGSSSMTVEAEVTAALSEVLDRLEFGSFRIHMNHRKLLSAMLEAAGIDEKDRAGVLISIDKLDKVGRNEVIRELKEERGIDREAIDRLLPLLGAQPTEVVDNEKTLSRLEEEVGHLDEGAQAIRELRQVLRYAEGGPAERRLMVDPYLARGLSYYTGPIFEIQSDDFSGSIGGGGRYDELVGMFTKESVPACGFSLGLERILLIMEERGQFHNEPAPADVLVTLWDEELAPESFLLAREFRSAGLRVDVYPDTDKYGKQFKYADERKIPFVAILASRELEAGVVAIKNLRTGDQEKVPRGEVIAWIQRALEV